MLDQSVARQGTPEATAVADTVHLARHCEALGYHRFWVSEHHNLGAIVGTAPEVLLGGLAVATTRIRLGSAGVMLPHYSAFKVAEQFRVLDALAPGRIDLGVGRAPGGDQRAARALNPDAAGRADAFPEQVHDLRAWVQPAEGAAHRGLVARPQSATSPDLWVLGSSTYGAQLAAHLGLPYAFAWFFADGAGAEEAIDLYRSLYRPSERHPVPQATFCVWALAAETDAAARYHALSREQWRLDRERGLFGALQPPDALAGRVQTAAEQRVVESMRERGFVGSTEQVAARLRRLAADFAMDELVVNTWSHDPIARLDSYALLAAAFDLAPRNAAEAALS